MKTLIVEDDSASRRIMGSMLAQYGECVLASNGMEAISVFQAETDRGALFDLVCLDILMPDISGHEVLKYIRSTEEERCLLPPDSVKVIMTSAMNDPGNVMSAFNSQCDSYLVKPILYKQLVEQLRFLDLENRV